MSEELRDFYYSEYTAAFDNGLCHTINGQKFTESVEHGEQPVTQNPNLVLVASGLPQSAVVYNTELIRLNRTRRAEIRIEPRGTLMQIRSETQTSRISYFR